MKGLMTQEMFNCIPEIEYNIGYRYFLGNVDNYANALMSTLKSIKSKLPILQSMWMTEEYQGLRTITQTLRRMLENIGAISLAKVTYQLETDLLNDEASSIQNSIAEYLERLMKFSEHLELLLKKMDLKASSVTKEQTSFLNYDFTKTKESIEHSSNYLKRRII